MRKHTYRKDRLKTKHHILKEAIPYMEALQRLPFIKLIVPDVINNNSHGRNRMRLSCAVENGFRLNFGGAGAQKFHVVCEPSEEHRRIIEEKLAEVEKR